LFPVISSSILFSALFIIVFMMPFYLTYPCGFQASKTGLIMVTPFLFLLFISPLSGMLYDRFGSRLLCMVGMSLLAISLISLLYLHPSMGTFPILWRLAFAGIGTGLFVTPNSTTIMSCIPLSRRGVASGAVATARNLGMVTGVALAGAIFSTSFSSLTNGSSLENYSMVMEPFFLISFRRALLAGIIILIPGLIATFARGKENKTQII
jgi:MFS family permease